jgi:hypothetical protein
MRNVFGLRRIGHAAMLMRGQNGRAIRQHLGRGSTVHHGALLPTTMGRSIVHHGALLPTTMGRSIVHHGALLPTTMGKGVAKRPKAITLNGRTHIPLRFRL